jgi:hypothetical protein
LQNGDVMKAHDMFDQARWAEEDLGADTVEEDYWIAECLIREGDAKDAATLAEHALRAEQARGSTMFTSRLHRVFGYAWLATGDPAKAAAEFERAVEAARGAHIPYEVALGLEGLAHAGAAAGNAERDEIYARLGVRRTFPPLAP